MRKKKFALQGGEIIGGGPPENPNESQLDRFELQSLRQGELTTKKRAKEGPKGPKRAPNGPKGAKTAQNTATIARKLARKA